MNVHRYIWSLFRRDFHCLLGMFAGHCAVDIYGKREIVGPGLMIEPQRIVACSCGKEFYRRFPS